MTSAPILSGITGRPIPPIELYIGQIGHRAVIEVTEESTEAAAATAIKFRNPTAQRPATKPELVRVDRPFQFYIVDNVTGAIFAGRISSAPGICRTRMMRLGRYGRCRGAMRGDEPADEAFRAY